MTRPSDRPGLAASLTGTLPLSRLILRRDRILLPLWVLILAVIPSSYSSATASLFGTETARRAFAQGILDSPAQLAMLGPLFGTGVGPLTAWRSGLVYVIVGLASLLTVIRHTRSEEEAGRRELLGATVVGRPAGLAAALLVTGIADLVLGLVASVALAGTQLPLAGSLALGLGLTAVGWVFAAIGAAAAQLTEGARAARGIAVGVLAGAYILRAVGDSTGTHGASSWLSWLSPVGWAQQARPFADVRWWAFAPILVTTAVLGGLALAVCARRDHGAGLYPTRPGPRTASPGLRTPLALAWRLHRGALLGWSVGFTVLGVVVGAAAGSLVNQVGGNRQMAELLRRIGGTANLVDAYLAAAMSVLGLAGSAYAISAALRLRSEEEALRAEPVLATAVGRVRWVASHLTFALAGPALAVAAGGAGMGVVRALTTGRAVEIGRGLGAALAQLPAIWVLAGLALALFGLAPRWTAVSWGVLGAYVLLGQIGELLSLPRWALDLSPFSHLPRLPGGSAPAAPLIWLCLVAAGLVVAGTVGFRRRDLG
jgi:ABC-2 type transport system permease protein